MLQNMNNTVLCRICIWIVPEYFKVYSISSGNVECKSSWVSLSLSFEGRKIPLGYAKGGVLREDSINSAAFSPPFCDGVQCIFSAVVTLGGGWQRRRGACGSQLRGAVWGWAVGRCEQQQLPWRGGPSFFLHTALSLKEKLNLQVPGKREMPDLL